jgi:type 2 lantibiotic biosynthesis protein LanM
MHHLWVGADENPLCRSLIAWEKKDLENGDIPIFNTKPQSRHLWSSSGQLIEGALEQSGLELVRRRVQLLDDRDLDRQMRLIRASLTTLTADDGIGMKPVAPQPESQREVSREELLTEAIGIGDSLESLALHGDHQEVGWVSVDPVKDHYWTLSAAGLDLYGGLSGIGLFLIYLAQLTSEVRHLRLAQEVVATARHSATALRAEDRLPIGAFGPWGGMIYLLTHAGVVWRAPELLQEAERLIDQILPQIEQDEYLDIISGSAGCLAVLIGFYRVTASRVALAAAIRCGDRLVRSSRTLRVGAAWKTTSDTEEPLAGFSHGAAGIGWALLELAAITGEERFRCLAEKGFAYERTLFSPALENWPDLRIPSGSLGELPRQPRWITAWCHGAPGIGLSRVLSLRHSGDPELRSEIASAVRTTRCASMANHSLCHGTLGNLDFLLHASESMCDRELRSYIYRTAASIVESTRQTGWMCGVPAAAETPGLMVGLAGIGYGLLRLASPAEVPDVLALAAPH